MKYQCRSQSDWQALVSEQLKSGLSAPAFCKDQTISYPSFIRWKKKLTPSDAVSNPSATFLEITPVGTDTPVQPASMQPCVEVDIGSTLQLRIFSH